VKILVTGGTGMVGSAFREVNTSHNLVLIGSQEYDLTNYRSAHRAILDNSPDAIIHLAAKVGGIKANIENQGDFFTINSMINTNVLKVSKDLGIKKVVSLLSTCIYPNEVKYPLTEDQIHNGPPHESNYAYAHAKRMLDVQSRAYRDQYGCNFVTAVPNNLFGENDNFDLQNSHVIPAMIRKIYEAKLQNKNAIMWGNGTPLREFTYAADLAKILLFLVDNYDHSSPINVGNTQEISIKNVAEMIAEILDFEGEITWDTSKPNGQLRKPSDNSNLINLGWKKENYTDFKKALTKTCQWAIINYPNLRGIK
jgi:GDP-L-fucose synthase